MRFTRKLKHTSLQNVKKFLFHIFISTTGSKIIIAKLCYIFAKKIKSRVH